jgi:predicted ATPase/DNA-binding SARP family transcriptional activator
MPEEVARSNLRLTLSRLRGLVDDGLVITRQEVSFNFDQPHWLDVAHFETYALTPEQSPLEQLQTAVKLYQGEFLADFQVLNAPDFEAWVLLERERLRQLAVKALFYLAQEAHQREALAESIALTRRILEVEPWLEEAHQLLLWLLARSGQRSAALAQYELCRRALAEELGVEPAPATLELYQQIKEGKFEPSEGAVLAWQETPLRQSAARGKLPTNGHASVAISAPLPQPAEPASSAWSRPPVSRHNLPPPLTPFIGRESELAQIAERLASPECRLLTLVGPGGMGKTRLALAAAEAQLETFRDGVRFVSLAGIVPTRADEAVDLLVINIANALDYTFSAPHPPRDLLLNYLANQEMLLLLDNFEPLLALPPGSSETAAQFLQHLLQYAPGLKLLITSRERLGLKAEWLLDVTGLDYPQTPETAADYPAMQLFAQSVQRIKPDFDLASEAGAVSRICRFVQGYPLCLELAANWIRILSCQEIGANVERNLDILSTTSLEVADRHRSLRAVFDQSWNLLNEAEQQVFRRLSVFRDGLDLEAARQVAGASLPILAGLVEKSLLRRADEGRYELHELLRQYGAERLAALPSEQAETRRKHKAYYASFLEKRRPALENQPEPGAMREIERELGNIRGAWEVLLTQGEPETIANFLEGLWRFYGRKGWFQEAVLALEQAYTLAEVSALLRARWQRWLGEARYEMGQVVESEIHLREALALLGQPLPQTQAGWTLLATRHLLRQASHRLRPRRLVERETEKGRALLEAAQAFRRLGQLLYFAGDMLQMLVAALYSLNLAEQVGDSPQLAEVYATCTITAGTASLHALANRYSNLAFQVSQEVDRLATQAYVSETIGVYYCGVCRWAEAETLFEQAISGFNQLEMRRSWAECSSLLGKTFYYQGKYKQALPYFVNLLPAGQYHGDQAAQHWALLGQVECALRLGQPALDQVCAWLEMAKLLPADYPGNTQHVRFYGVLALTLMYRGDPALAQQAAQTGLDFMKRGGFIAFWAVEGYAGIAETFLSLWEANKQAGEDSRLLAKSAQQACRALHQFARTYPLAQPWAWLYQGLYEWLAGKPEQAYKTWSQSLAAAERLGMPYQQARAHYELGRHLPSDQKAKDDLSYQAHLQRAYDLFAELGAAYDLARIEASVKDESVILNRR